MPDDHCEQHPSTIGATTSSGWSSTKTWVTAAPTISPIRPVAAAPVRRGTSSPIAPASSTRPMA